MKTITSKTAKNGVQLWYADGKRIAKSEIFTVATENHREIICKALAERNIAAASQTVKHDINLHFIAQITLVDNEFAAGWNEFSFADKAEAVSAVQAVKNALGDKFHEAVIFYKGGFYAPQDVLTKITADSDETDTDEVNDSDEVKAGEPQGYIFSKTLVSSGYSAHNNAHYSKLERIDKECKILGNSEQPNGSIYREVAFYNADHAHSWAVKTSDGKVIISGHDEPDFDKIVEAVKAYETADEVTENEETAEVKAAEVKVQAGTISICADAVGNGRVAVKVYGRHECAPAKIDSVAAEMPRLSDIHIVAHDNLDFIAKGASYNGRYYPLSNLYIFTNVSNGTDGFKKMYKFDTAKEALRKLARQELEDHIITAEAAAEITKADIEIERQREAKREAERAKREVEWAMYERARHLAAKIALDSKSVNDNFHYCIYCAPQQPVQSALAEDYHEDNNEVFNLLPTVDELNDVEIDDEAKTDEPEITDETDEDAHNTTEKIEVAIGADAMPAMIDLFEPNKITLNTPAQILKLIEDAAGNSFSFDYESYFINTDDDTRHKFITRHFVSECKNYSFIEIFTDDGKLDHVEFLKHFLAGYKEVKFYLAAPAQDNVAIDSELVNRMIDEAEALNTKWKNAQRY